MLQKECGSYFVGSKVVVFAFQLGLTLSLPQWPMEHSSSGLEEVSDRKDS